MRTPIRALSIAAVLGAIMLIGCGGDSESDTAATTTSAGATDTSTVTTTSAPQRKGSAHINTATGSANGLTPDERAGTPPPPLKTANLEAAAKQAGCDLRLKLKDEGHKHVATPLNFGTDPPTSGNHSAVPQADGAYLLMPAPGASVHSLEHGRLVIQYDPKLPESKQLELKGLYDTEYSGALLFPNPTMPYEVAATTWTNLLGCRTYDGATTLDAIRDFGEKTWGRFGGEPADAFGPLTGPTPADPSS